MLDDPSQFRRRLLRWYDANRRELPWRIAANSASPGQLDPYHVLISETMLQQTQVATVIPYFRRFLCEFPTIAVLAAADEQRVLRLWQGLGYYSRARNLHAAAKQITAEFGGALPRTVDELRALRGIGRYTAGAIASIAFGRREPIVDANIARVICRLDRIERDPRDRDVLEHIWQRAEELLPHKRLGDFNSALMELGALVCTPRRPACPACPVRQHCQAFAAGRQDAIPPARRARVNPLESRWTFCIRHRGKLLIEQRPANGRWAKMWQFITIPAATSPPAPTSAPAPVPTVQTIGPLLGISIRSLNPLGTVRHLSLIHI